MGLQETDDATHQLGSQTKEENLKLQEKPRLSQTKGEAEGATALISTADAKASKKRLRSSTCAPTSAEEVTTDAGTVTLVYRMTARSHHVIYARPCFHGDHAH